MLKYLMTNATRRKRDLLSRFRDEESGALIIFSLLIFLPMVLICGLAVDIMHFESNRTIVQATIDRAVLAAADLDQELDPETVVRDYFDKAGMTHCLQTVTVDEGLNYRRVSATTSCDFPTFFLKLIGHTKLTAPGAATAEESVKNIEISLVVDISGSMGSNNRLYNLKKAANNFVDTMIYDSDDVLTTISMIPYNASVNMGPALGAQYNLTGQHNYSHCAAFDYSDYTSTSLDRATELTQLGHFDRKSNSNETDIPITNTSRGPQPWCWYGTEKQIITHSSSVSKLQTAINDLDAYGNTAIDVGMRWGVALLDPSAQVPVENLIALGEVDSSAANRPTGYETSDNLKVVVLMTDGANTTQYDLKDEFKFGFSEVHVDRVNVGAAYGQSAPLYSLQIDGMDTPDDDTDDRWYHLIPERVCDGWGCRDEYVHDYPDFDGVDQDEATAMLWTEIFATYPKKRIYKQFYRHAYQRGFIDYSTMAATFYGDRSIVNSSQANARLSQICFQARQKGITIFSIAFEAPSAGKNALKDCASSISHYYEADGNELTDVFNSISSQINHLKLTQ